MLEHHSLRWYPRLCKWHISQGLLCKAASEVQGADWANMKRKQGEEQPERYIFIVDAILRNHQFTLEEVKFLKQINLDGFVTQSLLESVARGPDSGGFDQPRGTHHDDHGTRCYISTVGIRLASPAARYFRIHNSQDNGHQTVGSDRFLSLIEKCSRRTRDGEGIRLHISRCQETFENIEFFILPQYHKSKPYFYFLC